MPAFKNIAAIALALWALGAAGPAIGRDRIPLAAGARYVAMGSSFAAGAGISPFDPTAPVRCQRSTRSYARQLAEIRKLNLVDVTCGGATTAHVTGPWRELAPQIDALTPDTALVTITIGGNDVGYIGGLITGSCIRAATPGTAVQPLCRMIAGDRRGVAAMPAPTEDKWQGVEKAMTSIVQEIRRRSPRARIVFVDYLTVLPDHALCAQTPLTPEGAASGRATAARLARVTADVARRNGGEVLAASRLSRRAHNACARAPWMTGFIPPAGTTSFVPYHPNLAGMTAIAKELDRHLRR